MKTLAFIIYLIALTFVGCKTNSIPGVIKLDTAYKFYTREVFRVEEPGQEKRIQANIKKSDEAKTKKSREDLLEVQLLMISKSRHTAIYIAMKPDLNRSHYSAYRRNVLNTADIHTIRFGKTFVNDSQKIERIKFFSKDLYSSTTWEITPKDTSLYLDRIQYWWGIYDDKYLLQGIDLGDKPYEFLESEINVNEALRNKVFFIPTHIDSIKHKDLILPMPREGGLKFKASKKYKRMKATFESTPEIKKTFWNKQIRSSPLPLMVKE